MHEIILVSPFPAGEGGWGDRGQESKLTAWSAGGKEGKPPRRARRRGQSATPSKLSSAGHLLGGFCKCRKWFSAGVPGAKPPAK